MYGLYLLWIAWLIEYSDIICSTLLIARLRSCGEVMFSVVSQEKDDCKWIIGRPCSVSSTESLFRNRTSTQFCLLKPWHRGSSFILMLLVHRIFVCLNSSNHLFQNEFSRVIHKILSRNKRQALVCRNGGAFWSARMICICPPSWTGPTCETPGTFWFILIHISCFHLSYFISFDLKGI